MDLKLFRQSGMPVKLESLEAYQKDWKEFFDKASERAKLDNMKLTRFLSFGERALIRKHGSEIVIEMPNTSEKWQALIASYEDTPIMIARLTNSDGVVGIIMDTLM